MRGFAASKPIKALKRVLLCAIGFSSTWLGLSQSLASTGYQIDVWRAEDGLPQSTVTSVAQGREGYLWIGTQNGLVRFDGAAFKVFNQNNTPAIKNSRIVQLFVDAQSTLWVGAEEGNLVRFKDGSFDSFAMPGIGSPFNYARAICNDSSQNVWVMSCEWRLLRFASNNFTVPSINWTLAETRATAVGSDRSGRVYVGSDRELAVWKDGKFQAVWGQVNEPGFQVDFLATSRWGGCWVAGNGRLRRFDDGRWVADLGSYHWTNQPVYGLFEDTRNQVWVATLGSGLFRFSRDQTTLQITTRDGLPSDFVRCVIEDREGNIWAGMEGGGLCRLKSQTFQALGTREGLSSDQVMSLCEAADGSFWIGMNGSGLDHLSGERVEHYGQSQGLMNGHVWSVIQDHSGRVWAGTWGGLFRLEKGRFVGQSDGVQIGGVALAMYEDHKHGIWLGQQAVSGLTRLGDGETKTLNLPGATGGLDIRVITEDHQGRLWIGTENQGLYCWNGSECIALKKTNGLGSDTIWSLLAEADDTVWIGTCGGGLSRWRGGHITTWTTREGLKNDVICQILDDSRGNLWLGSYGGVFHVSKAELDQNSGRGGSPLPAAIQCTSYGRGDGLPSIECQGGFQPSGLKSRDGRLWFPTIKGFAVVNPEEIATNSVPPTVLVERMVVDGVDQSPEIEKNLSSGRTSTAVDLPPGKTTVEFHYTATSLTAPEKVQFKYRLAGLESQWVNAGTKRSASYSRLPPGKFEFHVAACNNDGIWNEQGATLAVNVLPYFWQTSWFLALAIIASLVSVAGIANYVTQRRMHRRLELAERQRAIEQERTRIAQDMHDDLGSHLTEIALLSEFAQNPEASQETVQADIRKIMTKARTLTASLDEIVWAVEPENDSLDSFITYACSFAEHHLGMARISCRLELPEEPLQAALLTEVRHNLFLAFKEALNNVVKHAQATETRIRIAQVGGSFVVTVRDNGRGFDPSHKNGSFDDAALQPSGLANIRKRMAAIHGRCEINSKLGAGAEVRLSVPQGPA